MRRAMMYSVSLARRVREGSILILSAVFLTVVFAMVAFSVDMGFILLVDVQMQNAADATALATLMAYRDQGATSDVESSAKASGLEVAALNSLTYSNAINSNQISFGYWDSESRVFTSPATTPNAVKVHASLTDDKSNALPLFFGPVIGHKKSNLSAESIAAFPPVVSREVIPLALRNPSFGVVSPTIYASNPGKPGPSKPANGTTFKKGDTVILFTFGSGSGSPVHLTLIPASMNESSVRDVIEGESSPVSVKMKLGETAPVIGGGTGTGGIGSDLEERLNLSPSSPLRTVYVPVVAETSSSRNGSGTISGHVVVEGFVKVFLKSVNRVRINFNGSTIDNEHFYATVDEDQISNVSTSSTTSDKIRLVR